MGNLIADAIVAAVGAGIAIINGGGMWADRTDDAETRLLRRDIPVELPCIGATVTTEPAGSQVLAALANRRSRVARGSGRFAQVSGLRLADDPGAGAGSRMAQGMVGGQAIDPGRVNRGANNDFLLGGGAGYTAPGGGRVIIDGGNGTLMANDVMAASGRW